MALIPPDAALRLRMQTEANLSPVTPLKELPADLPELRPGQTFMARIQQPLPENTYRALVAGKEITLQLPDAAKSGDTLELVVVDRTPRLVVAQFANRQGTPVEEGGETANAAKLSPAGQLIGKLLLPAGQEPEPVPLNRGAALLSAPLPPAGGLATVLAPRLQQAAAQSGLFYEAHQALWLNGQRSTAALLAEPQARHAAIGAAATAQVAPEAEANRVGALEKGTTPSISPQGSSTTESGTPSTAKDLLQSIPAELRPLVQQQLDAAATQRLVWQGEVWPGQTMQWQLSRELTDEREAQAGEVEEADRWNTTISLTTPRLGRVEANLGIAGGTVRIAIKADAGTAARLNASLPALRSALEAAGLNPVGLQITNAGA